MIDYRKSQLLSRTQARALCIPQTIPQLKMFLVVSVCSLMFGAGMIVLFAHAVDRQQVVMQEGY